MVRYATGDGAREGWTFGQCHKIDLAERGGFAHCPIPIRLRSDQTGEPSR